MRICTCDSSPHFTPIHRELLVSRKTILYASTSKKWYQVYPSAPIVEAGIDYSRVSRGVTFREHETLTMSLPQNSSQPSQLWDTPLSLPLKRKSASTEDFARNVRFAPPTAVVCSCCSKWENAQLMDTALLFSGYPSQSLPTSLFVKNWSFLRLNLHPSIPPLTSPSCLWKILALDPLMLPISSSNTPVPPSDLRYHPCELIFIQNNEFQIIARVGSDAMSHIFGNIPPLLLYSSLLTFHLDESWRHRENQEELCDYSSLVYRVLQAFLSISRPKDEIPNPSNPCFDLLFHGVGEAIKVDSLTISLELSDLRDHRREENS